jgi:hypothetical protein
MADDDAHCGPVALANVLKLTAAAVMAEWPDKWTSCKSDKKWLFWPIDTPKNHRKYLESQGLRMVEIIGDGIFQPGMIALVHNFKWGRNPITKFIGSMFMQHWITIISDDGNTVVADWGTEKKPTRTMPKSDFLKYINSGWPRCVYKIGKA